MFKPKGKNGPQISKPVFVISATRVHLGGALEVVNDLLQYLNDHHAHEYDFIVLVYRKNLYKNFSRLCLREYTLSRKSFIYRLYLEYVGFYFLSKKLKPGIWLSMQDSTPFVKAEKQFTYWHSPLLQRGLRKEDLKYDLNLFLLTILYRFVYSKIINRNKGVFVQQFAMKEFLQKRLGIDKEKLHVAPLIVKTNGDTGTYLKTSFVFLYPSYPYSYKNFRQIIRAAKIAYSSDCRFEVWLTANGNENKYIKEQYRESQSHPFIKWIGYQTPSDIKRIYGKADALIYVSEYETWGIPISVFKKMQKPIITVDLPYAHETVSDYNKAKFVAMHDDMSLAKHLKEAVNDQLVFDQSKFVENSGLFDWKEVFEIMHNYKNESHSGYIRRLQLRPTVAETV